METYGDDSIRLEQRNHKNRNEILTIPGNMHRSQIEAAQEPKSCVSAVPPLSLRIIPTESDQDVRILPDPSDPVHRALRPAREFA